MDYEADNHEAQRKSTRVNDRSGQSSLAYKTFRAISSFVVGIWFAVTIAQGSRTRRRKPQGKTENTWVVFERKKAVWFRKRRRFLCRDTCRVERAYFNFLYGRNRSLWSLSFRRTFIFYWLSMVKYYYQRRCNCHLLRSLARKKFVSR